MNIDSICATNMQRIRMSLLAAALMSALGNVSAQSPSLTLPAIPQSWPLPYERQTQTTPLRARMEAMLIARPAPTGYRIAQIPVTHCADDGTPGSLRTAVASAISGDTVDLTQLTCSRISLTQGAIDIEVDELAFIGPGADRLSIDGNDQDRVFYHAAPGPLLISNLTIERGHHTASGTDVGFGGCIATGADLILESVVIRDCIAQGVGSYGGAVLSGFLQMANSTISGNTAFGDHPTNGTAAYGGGAFSYGVDIVDSTFDGNRAIGTHNPPLSHWEIGGGLFIARNGGTIERTTISNNYAMRFAGGLTQEGDLILRNSTISGNSTRDDDGGGLRVRQVTSVIIENTTITNNSAGSTGGGVSFINFAQDSTSISSIIAGNRAGSGIADVDSLMPLTLSGSNNLVTSVGSLINAPPDTITDNPRLLALANNGGPTQTHALAANSPAIDRGINTQALTNDQRGSGFERDVNGVPDIGSFEFQGGTPEPVRVELPSLSTWASLLLGTLLAAFGLNRARLRPDVGSAQRIQTR